MFRLSIMIASNPPILRPKPSSVSMKKEQIRPIPKTISPRPEQPSYPSKVEVSKDREPAETRLQVLFCLLETPNPSSPDLFLQIF